MQVYVVVKCCFRNVPACKTRTVTETSRTSPLKLPSPSPLSFRKVPILFYATKRKKLCPRFLFKGFVPEKNRFFDFFYEFNSFFLTSRKIFQQRNIFLKIAGRVLLNLYSATAVPNFKEIETFLKETELG